MDITCSVAECQDIPITRGMCNKHYRRALAAGEFEPVFGLPVMLRLERKSIVNPVSQCREWMGARTRNGYGKIGIGKKTSVPTHRAAWEAVNGAIPDGLFVLHKCDNRACVNVEHLFLGTCHDNHVDMDSKGRRAVLRGSDNGQAKLMDCQVSEILLDDRPVRRIAEDYGISFSHVAAIKRAEKWRHLSGVTNA